MNKLKRQLPLAGILAVTTIASTGCTPEEISLFTTILRIAGFFI